MNPKSLPTLIASLNLSMVTFFFFPENCVCVDTRYEACLPKNCGDGQNISFPFWIKDVQESNCGYPDPGFGLTCQNGRPILHIPNNDYVVQEIFYHNQSFRVHNAAVLNPNSVCVPTIQNLTFESDQFMYDNSFNVSELFLLSNCSVPLSERLLRYELGCDAGNGAGWGLAMFGNDTNFGFAMEQCDTKVAAPVEVYGEDYGELLRRGFVLVWKASNCSICEQSGGRCGFNESDYHFSCFCPDRPHAWRCASSSRTRMHLLIKAAIAASTAGIGVLIIILALCLRRKFSLGESMGFWKKKTENYRDIEAFLRNYGSLAPKRYSYADVKKMTDSFKCKLGQGGYGCVYKGKLHNGSVVAVKVLNESKGSGEEFINEVASISRTSHVNIVTLLGFCFEGSKRALIYEFLPNGSLEKFIYDCNSMTNRQLGWETLYQIAVGIAQGLEYLHQGCNTQILHFDIKPHNILLDEDFSPKISDFGLAKLCPRKESVISMLGARGTAGYIAPEVCCRSFGGVSHKSDVYSYGMMILEMVGGRKNIDAQADRTSEIYFPHWIHKRLELGQELGLHGIINDEQKDSARKMIIVGLWCIQINPSDRPPMSRVVAILKGSLETLHIPPAPFLSSPVRSPTNSSTTLVA